MEVTILGCHSATPRSSTRPPAQLLEMRGHLSLIDCGEAIRIALRNANARFAHIKHIFISHLHGGRFYELFGLILTFQLLGREARIHVYGPKGIEEAALPVLKLEGVHTPSPLCFHELSGKGPELLYEGDKVSVRIVPLQHRMYTNGFFFQEKEEERRLNMNAMQQYPEIEVCGYRSVRNGKDVALSGGEVIANEILTFVPQRPQSHAYCSDTLYFEGSAADTRGTRVVYRESTFLKNNEELAAKTMHATAYQAGLTAKNTGAEALILGHYSSRYTDVNLFEAEAQEVFPNVHLAEDDKKIVFN